MGEILKFLLSMYLLMLIIGGFVAMIRFFIDVGKWHDREEKVKITPSQFETDLNEPVETADNEETTVISAESGVIEDVAERPKRNSPIVF